MGGSTPGDSRASSAGRASSNGSRQTSVKVSVVAGSGSVDGRVTLGRKSAKGPEVAPPPRSRTQPRPPPAPPPLQTQSEVEAVADRVAYIPEEIIPLACKERPGSSLLYKREYRALERLQTTEDILLPEVLRTVANGTPVEPPKRYYRSTPLKVPKARATTTKIDCSVLTGRLLSAKERRKPDPNPFDAKPRAVTRQGSRGYGGGPTENPRPMTSAGAAYPAAAGAGAAAAAAARSGGGGGRGGPIPFPMPPGSGRFLGALPPPPNAPHPPMFGADELAMREFGFTPPSDGRGVGGGGGDGGLSLGGSEGTYSRESSRATSGRPPTAPDARPFTPATVASGAPSPLRTPQRPREPPPLGGVQPLGRPGGNTFKGKPKPAPGAKDPAFYHTYTHPLEMGDFLVSSGAILKTFNVQAQEGAMGHKSELYGRMQESLYQFDPAALTMSERIAAHHSPACYGLSARTLQLPTEERPVPPPLPPDLADIMPDYNSYAMPPELEGIVEADGVMKQVVEDVKNMISYLPLELFEFQDPRTPQDWVELGLKRDPTGATVGYTVGRTPFYNIQLGEFEWRACHVLQYDEEERAFRVKMVDGGSDKVVKRLNLRFTHPVLEDEKEFMVRVAGAKTLRAKAEAVMRYHHYIETMSDDGILVAFDHASIIKHLAKPYLHGTPHPVVLRLVDSFKSEMYSNYLRAMKEAQLAYRRLHPLESMRLYPLHFAAPDAAPPVPARAKVGLFEEADPMAPGPEEEYGGFTLPGFHDTVDWLQGNCYILQPKLVKILFSMFACKDRIYKALLFHKGEQEELPLQLDTFLGNQASHLARTHATVDNAVLEMAVEVPMSEEIIGVTERAEVEWYSDLVKGVGQLQRFCVFHTVDELHGLVIKSCQEYARFLHGFEPPVPKPPEPLPNVVKDNGQLFSKNLLQVRLWVEAEDEDYAGPHAVLEVTPPVEEGAATAVRRPRLAFVPSAASVEAALHSTFDNMLSKAGTLENIFMKISGHRGHVFKANGWADDALVCAARAEKDEVVARVMTRLAILCEMYIDLVPSVYVDEAAILEELADESVSLDEYQRHIDALYRAIDQVQATSANDVYTGVVEVHCAELRTLLCARAYVTIHNILTHLQSKIHTINERIHKDYLDMENQLMKVSEDVEEVLGLESLLESSEKEREQLENQIRVNKGRQDFIYRYRHYMDDEMAEASLTALKWPKRMAATLEAAQLKVVKERMGHEVHLRKRTVALTDLLTKLRERVDDFKEVGCQFEDEAKIEENSLFQNSDTVESIDEKLQYAAAEAAIVQRDEKMLEWKRTDFPQIEALNRDFEPFATLWRITSAYYENDRIWMSQPFRTLDADKIDTLATEWYRKAFKLTKFFSNRNILLKVAEWTRVQTERLRKLVPLVRVVTNPGLRKRHWDKASDIAGFKIAPTSDTLETLLDNDCMTKMAELDELSDCASREYTLETTLEKMQVDWQSMVFELTAWRDTGSFILKGSGVEEAQLMLDEHIIKTQAMKSSPFAQPIYEGICMWEATLSSIEAITEQWLVCQQKWIYLEPVYGSEEILKQMPNEGRLFQGCDKYWRGLMEKVAERPEILLVVEMENLCERLKETNETLMGIEKKLNDYLDTKKMACPRFWFLSNEELLEILRETKDPLNVQPFVKKLIEAIRELEFQEDLTITAMVSLEGERVPFDKPVNPNGDNNGVELWMVQVEDQMRTSLHSQVVKAKAAYTTEARTDWIRHWPGQLVIGVSQVFWTKEVAETIRKGGARGLLKFAKACTDELMNTVTLVRGTLTKLERATIGALVVIDVHARDVVQKMGEDGVSKEHDFKWLSQLRYYWEEDTLMVRMINAEARYGYEYLGNSSRLVITPLTDRCYRTLLGAVHLNLGGAPAGPAGTGKTETTKDLSKAIAIQCVVFNCSDGLDYIAMGKFFKGLASCGAWACFDEFNRIELEVLSVVAQQVLTIQRALAAQKTRFQFEGVEIALRHTCNVFITMNPGYAGRSELPDNLKALFRDVAMMVPDYALISEIILYSFGYLEARVMGQKLVMTYTLCSEQLSKQDHYDYGMRAVMAVLRAAGNLKQKPENKELTEDVLMLRAIQDVNLPKFLDEDVPLFNGILSDLFPGVKLPEADYVNLYKVMEANTIKQNLQPLDAFFIKIIQLYEMIIVRHGLMLVGQAFAMKTSAIRVLKEALGDLHAEGLNDEVPVKTHTLNPKAISLGQLYGQDDPISQEWTDGVLAKLFRDLARDTSPDRKWLIFDGPVDAIWIESMNTVLDDNKKLCLNSGEIVAMQGLMNLIFEVQDLAVASPATVSRCGMVYMQPSQLGWRPTMLSWLAALPETVPAAAPPILTELFDWLVPPALRLATKECRMVVPMQEINLVMSAMRLVSSLMVPDLVDPEFLEGLKGEGLRLRLEGLVVFSLVWSVGVVTDQAGRDLFDLHFTKILAGDPDPAFAIYVTGTPVKLQAPPAGPLYNLHFDAKTGKWSDWLDTVQKQEIPFEVEFTNITVQTVDSIRYTFLIDLLTANHKHLLLVGPTGTGKSLYTKNHLSGGMDKEQWQYMTFTFSAQTSANMTQDIIDGKLDKRRRGVYGPRVGRRYVIFVDELNMPAVEEYGAQPPIELLRQWMDHEGWYDRKELMFRTLVDIQFVAAMGPPGGGRASVTNRYLRHYSVVTFTEVEPKSLTLIFTRLVKWWFARCNYGEEISKFDGALVRASLDIYESAMTGLLPTPTKMHYIFNLRDLSKVFQGMQAAASSVDDKGELVRLWTHEVLRVFSDRLVDETDRDWLVDLMRDRTETHFNEKYPKLMGRLNNNSGEQVGAKELRHLMFCDFMIPGADPQIYDEVLDERELFNVVNGYLGDYNSMTKAPMNLVIFLYAMEHLSRICRIIKQPGGHALLIGVGGSGRQSLTRLAASIQEYEVIQVEIVKGYGVDAWRDDLKKALRMAGESNKRVIFLLADTQIQWEGMVEDISNLLNTSDVPNLFDGSDQAQIGENVRNRAKAAGMDANKTEIYNFFISEVRRNLHCVLCFSPVGEAIRTRLRKFPSLITCMTINWFSAWPDDALLTVSNSFLSEVSVVPEDDKRNADMQARLARMCVFFHTNVQDYAARFAKEARRYFYVTPTSYLELLRSFKALLDTKRAEVLAVQARYENGLEKLLQTEAQVSVMQEELVELQPKLVVAGQETAALMQTIEVETVEADKVKAVVSKEAAAANEEADKVKAIESECNQDLAVAMPMLHEAIKALDTLRPADISEVKGMQNPPKGVKLVMEAVCIMKNLKAARVKQADGSMGNDFWETSKKMVSDPKFLQSLKEYDKDNIDPAIIKRIKVYVDDPGFEPQLMKKAAVAAVGLCAWVRAIYQYDGVAKVVKPKQIALAAAQEQLAVVMAALKIKEDELAEVVAKLNALDSQLKEATDKKVKLESDVLDCEQKLERAQQLISGLGGEKARWTTVAQESADQLVKLTGDVLLGVGSIAYLGAFTSGFRSDITKEWVAFSGKQQVPCSSNFSLVKILGNPVAIREWNINGLPRDELSVENGIIMHEGSRWPLCIDPQGQANKWIRKTEDNRQLRVVKLSDETLLRTLESAITFGSPVLLENVGEVLDASLEPILLKQTFKQSGRMCIKLGESIVEWNADFAFYIATKLRNPHYAPEMCTKVSLLNFMITPEGLEDQLLGIVVAVERPDLEEEKNVLIVQGAQNMRKLKEIEDRTLHTLSSSEGNILDDATAVGVLNDAKKVSDEINEKQKVAEETEKKIDAARADYKPCAKHTSIVFFAVADMANIDPMYQYSLGWFISLFVRAINDSPKEHNIKKRTEGLNSFFTFFLYRQVCQSLFEKDKMLFAFLLVSRMLLEHSAAVKGAMEASELRFLLTGGIAMDNPHPNPAPDWLTEKAWGELCRLDQLGPAFDGLREFLADGAIMWHHIFTSPSPVEEEFPAPFQEQWTPFQRILLIRAMRPDKIVPAVQKFVMDTLGTRYVEPQPFNLSRIFSESTCHSPLVFILSPGSDPLADLLKFADDLGSRVESVSLGQGQGPIAQNWINKGIAEGFWVVLMNCHLAKSFLPKLEQICENQLTSPDTHNLFRLWLTSYPSNIFPIAILENGVKITSEAPKAFRSALLRLYESDPITDHEFFTRCSKPDPWRKMLFSLCFFHCAIRQRRSYGPIGWNIPYEFNENDLRISMRQLKMFLDEYDDVPFDTLTYTCGECNYGGKVTDAQDRRLLMTLLDDFYHQKVLKDEHQLCGETYHIPLVLKHDEFKEFIKNLPLIASPNVFGLHDNADITRDIQESGLLLDSFQLTQGRSGGEGEGGDSFEVMVDKTATDILSRLADDFDIETAQERYPVTYLDSMNTVLCQELERVNTLLRLIRSSLRDVKKAVNGLVVMSEKLEKVGVALSIGKVPALWLTKSFPSLKPLASYVKEVIERVKFYNTWLTLGPPTVFWISGFFFTHSFMTAAKQNFARKHKLAIDMVSFDFEVKDQEGQCDEPPPDGVYTQGLFIEGCRWDYSMHVLEESEPKTLFTAMPPILLRPDQTASIRSFKNYECPLYKTSERRGILSTTGHSTNYVMPVRLPTQKPPEHWTKRGVAMLTSLDD